MLPKNKRVTKELFQKIIKTGGSLSGLFFIFRYINSNAPRYAFVVPKSVAKKAVDRNKLRRIGYRAMFPYLSKNISGIFFYKKSGKQASFQEIKSDIENLFKKLK
ncbi:MAG TPA: ribonuclease P protein component [Candidatus Paceibacterota bacterium]|nr:ribonuclease P protein component [Candidatus Paceibacterota bacterium]